MAVYKEKDNECYGCETCVNCGRNEEAENTYLECDECGDIDDVENIKLYIGYNDRQLCKSCYVKDFVKNCSKEELVDMVECIGIDTVFDYLSENAEEVSVT